MTRGPVEAEGPEHMIDISERSREECRRHALAQRRCVLARGAQFVAHTLI